MRSYCPQTRGVVEEVEVRILERSLDEIHLEGQGCEGGAHCGLHARQRTVLPLEVEGVHQGSEELEQFHFGQDIPETHPSTWTQNNLAAYINKFINIEYVWRYSISIFTYPERDEVFRLEKLSVFIQESFGFKQFRFVPEVRVHVYRVA